MCSDLLIPRDPLKARQPDEHWAPEAQAATSLGLRVHLVDHDAIAAGDMVSGLPGLPQGGTNVVYRGWMIAPNRYQAMTDELQLRGVELRTSPRAFASAHHLPNWYEEIAELTAESVWTTSSDLDGLIRAAGQLGPGPAVLKDYSKSEKHYWDEAMFIPDVTDSDKVSAVAARFLELRSDYFDTGFVLRRFETWEPGEWRSWWLNGDCVAVTAHPDTPHNTPADLNLESLRPGIRSLGLPFISVDLAVSATTGALRIVEIGDGQVSGRPATDDPARFITAIVGSPEPLPH